MAKTRKVLREQKSARSAKMVPKYQERLQSGPGLQSTMPTSLQPSDDVAKTNAVSCPPELIGAMIAAPAAMIAMLMYLATGWLSQSFVLAVLTAVGSAAVVLWLLASAYL